MKEIIKHKWEDLDKIYVSSDWHNYHDPKWDIPIWKMRGYISPEESKEDVIDKINNKVGLDDILYYLGDGFLNSTDEQCLEWFLRINCKNIYYIFGNHESNIHRIYKKECYEQYGVRGIEVYPLKYKNITFLGNYQEIQIGKHSITLTHFPMHGWNKNAHGAINLHGHCHNNDSTRNPEHHMGKCLDCSWDYKNDVWKMKEIFDIMSTKEILITDHH
jgi:calcineurin-like phosphoesterase family protein